MKDGSVSSTVSDAMTFGAAVELSVAMPLSWLPLISDYTRDAEEPVKASFVSSVVYGVISCWMYLIGMGAALFTGESDIAKILLKAGLGIVGLFVVILSTVTTTFLDAWSAGISSESVSKKLNGKWVAIIATVIGTIGAIAFPMQNIKEALERSKKYEIEEKSMDVKAGKELTDKRLEKLLNRQKQQEMNKSPDM